MNVCECVGECVCTFTRVRVHYKGGHTFVFAYRPCRREFCRQLDLSATLCMPVKIDCVGMCVHTPMCVKWHLTLVWTVFNIGPRRSNIVQDFPKEADVVLCHHPCPVSLLLPLIPPKL